MTDGSNLADDNIFVSITHEALQTETFITQVQDDGAGAIATFTGVTRDTFNGKKVLKLEYEGYQPMAKSKLQVIQCLNNTDGTASVVN